MESKLIIRGRLVTPEDIKFIRNVVAEYWDQGRSFISRYICLKWNWLQPNGRLKDMACCELLRRLEQRGYIVLPPPKNNKKTNVRKRRRVHIDIDTTPIETNLKELLPIELRMVRGTEKEVLFRALLDNYHYLGYRQIVGAHLKYIAFSNGRPLACIGWGSAALKVACRDNYIGWSPQIRLKNLHLIAQNVRFLIPPWIRVPHLASYLLGMNARVLSADWQRLYAHPVVLLETFVDKERFNGTCYRAANWIYIGETAGRGRYDRYSQRSKPVKLVFVYPLYRNFRRILMNE
jgi:hypothetical protein